MRWRGDEGKDVHIICVLVAIVPVMVMFAVSDGGCDRQGGVCGDSDGDGDGSVYGDGGVYGDGNGAREHQHEPVWRVFSQAKARGR